MPPSSDAAARLEGGSLHLSGRIDRRTVPSLWPALPAGGFASIDLAGVVALDTVGLALVAEACARAAKTAGAPAAILHAPAGFDELRSAYRLAPDLR
ncbi:STAS domain-containing protein [Coralloluteibacterium stylophorae]|uniref:STAS domain-containing protein n=1 Tax=Coralloluteibacterium stylophorae TaxID=1776034 RepID=A0A8J7VSG0_9GAMM|nr:STAS domain-containing protein [Coralloluteibacterium stylophorae]MBS7458156.1 STAS domain-containing protein [Coralloluteibacterium stylophorae]